VTGIIQTWNDERGFGLILPLIGRPSDVELVFAHISGVVGRAPGETAGLPTGCEVDFQLVRSANGRPQAACIRPRTLSAKVLLKRAKLESAPHPAPVSQTTGETVALPVGRADRLP
jgi:cold shock CspA family protein